MDNEFHFPEELRARAAFALLSSSSMARYARAAREFASDSEVSRMISLNDVSTQRLLAVARRLRGILAAESQRQAQEVDLALLLCILTSSADATVDEFLRQVGMSGQPSLAWASALSRHLYAERASNTTTSQPMQMDVFVTSWTVPPDGLFVRYPPNAVVLNARQSPEHAAEAMLRAA